MRRSLLLLALVLVAAIAAVPIADAATSSVGVRDNFFTPKTKTIKKNGSVKFSWSKADNPHNVTFSKKAGRPKNCGTKSSGTCTRKFKTRGTFKYVCTIHFGMKGSIRVK
jgi:plastocyanin